LERARQAAESALGQFRRTGAELAKANTELREWTAQLEARVAERTAALRETSERLKRVLEVETVGVMFWDLTTGCLVDANETFLKLMGYSRQDVEARTLTWQKLTPPEYMEVSAAEVRKFMVTGRVGPYEKEYLRKDGTRQWLVFAGSSLGENACVEFCVDISNRKKTEAALRESEQRFRLLVTLSPVAMGLVDPDGVIRFLNDHFTRLFGYTIDDVPTLAEWWRRAYPDEEYRRRVVQIWTAAVAKEAPNLGTTHPREWEIRCKNGTQRIVRISSIHVGDDILVCFVDLTERKRVEEALSQSERQLQSAQAVAHVGSWHLDLRQDRLTWSAETCRLFARPVSPLTYAEFQACIHPEDRAVLHQVWQATLAGAPYDLEHRILAGGEIKWVHQRAALEYDSQGAPIGCLGTVQDITERKQVEAALQESEAWLLRAQEIGHVGSYAWDVETGKLVWSAETFRQLGLNPGGFEPTFEAFQQCVHPEDRPAFAARVRRALTEKSPFEMEVRIVRPDGTTRVLESRAEIELDTQGQPRRVVGVCLDITVRKEAEAELLRRFELQDQLAKVAATVPGMVFSFRWRPDGTVCLPFCTPVIEELWGFRSEELRYDFSPAFARIHPDDAARVREAIAESGRTMQPWRSTFRVQHPQRGELWIEGNSVPRREPDGSILWHGFAQDVTERERVEEEIRQLNASLEQRVRDRTAQLEAANQELEAFSYSVSHDLRAPLRAIDGFIRILQSEYGPRLDTEGDRLIGVVSSEAKRMGRLIDDLLAFSRLGRQSMKSAAVDMMQLAQAVFDGLAGTSSQLVRFDLKPLPPAWGDAALLRQVFANLLGNALKFSRQQAAPVIEVGASCRDDRVTYYVKDNGVGFEPRYTHKLFGVFQRLHSEEEFEGTGVGLALVQRVIHRHGGRIWAESKPGAGATFFFDLPIQTETKP
jgi:PAS domain S-box-containing protein